MPVPESPSDQTRSLASYSERELSSMIQSKLDHMIMATPTGETRNALTEINLLAIALVGKLNDTSNDATVARVMRHLSKYRLHGTLTPAEQRELNQSIDAMRQSGMLGPRS